MIGLALQGVVPAIGLDDSFSDEREAEVVGEHNVELDFLRFFFETETAEMLNCIQKAGII